MDLINLIVVEAFATQIEADVAKSLLDSAGMESMIQSDRDHLAWSGFGFKLLGREQDAQEYARSCTRFTGRRKVN